MYTNLLAILPLLLAPVVESVSVPLDSRADLKVAGRAVPEANRRLVRRVVRRGGDSDCGSSNNNNSTGVDPGDKEHQHKPHRPWETKTRPHWKPRPTGDHNHGDDNDDDDDEDWDDEDEDDGDWDDEDEDERPTRTKTDDWTEPTASDSSSSSSSTTVWWTTQTTPWWTTTSETATASSSSSCSDSSASASSSSSGWGEWSSSASSTSTGWGEWSSSATATPSPSSSSSGWGEWSSSSSSSATTTSSGSKPQSTSDWQLVTKIAGNEFFDPKHWWFWSFDDPTHGDVHYVDAGTAWNDGLVSINERGNAIMKVDTTPYREKGKRKSVRIHGTRVFTGGMVLMDAVHMPTGCGTWPAWWQNGPNWPHGGEIDILEGVNDNTQNQVSLHTGPGCTMPHDFEQGQTGILHHGNYDYDAFNCGSAATFNQGCGVLDRTSDASYGESFNNANGGVYALVWADYAIQVYFFKRSQIPQDITDGSPDPDNWGTPVANFPTTSCSPYEAFYDNFNIFDTTLCGDWAGSEGAWSSCAAKTGYATCSEYVANEGASFKDAYWEVVSVTYYNSTNIYP